MTESYTSLTKQFQLLW